MVEDRDQVYNTTNGHYGKAYRVYLAIVVNPELGTRTGFGSFSGETTEEFRRMKDGNINKLTPRQGTIGDTLSRTSSFVLGRFSGDVVQDIGMSIGDGRFSVELMNEPRRGNIQTSISGSHNVAPGNISITMEDPNNTK
jgi:hypothetical protein